MLNKLTKKAICIPCVLPRANVNSGSSAATCYRHWAGKASRFIRKPATSAMSNTENGADVNFLYVFIFVFLLIAKIRESGVMFCMVDVGSIPGRVKSKNYKNWYSHFACLTFSFERDCFKPSPCGIDRWQLDLKTKMFPLLFRGLDNLMHKL